MVICENRYLAVYQLDLCFISAQLNLSVVVLYFYSNGRFLWMCDIPTEQVNIPFHFNMNQIYLVKSYLTSSHTTVLSEDFHFRDEYYTYQKPIRFKTCKLHANIHMYRSVTDIALPFQNTQQCNLVSVNQLPFKFHLVQFQ